MLPLGNWPVAVPPNPKDASVDITNQPRIVKNFKTIRDLAPQDAGDVAAMWDAARTIQELVKDIQASLDPDESFLEAVQHQD